jgi:hypothetical protein
LASAPVCPLIAASCSAELPIIIMIITNNMIVH